MEPLEGWLLLPDSSSRVRLGFGAVHVRGGTIERVVERPRAQADPACTTLISPGFVDAHVHLPQFDSIGIAGLELLDWLDRVIFPAEARWADSDFAGAMADRAGRRLLSYGTTAVAAYATVHHAAAQASIDALAALGLSGHVGQVLMDREAPPELVRPADQLVREASQLAPRGRIAPSVTPRFAITCSDRLLSHAGKLAAATGWLVQTHLAETRREIARVGELFGGLNYLSVYERAGLLTDRAVFAHAVHLGASDRVQLAAGGGTIAHCPGANLFLNAGAMDRAAALAAGVRTALGSDIAGGPDHSMIRVARAMIETAWRLGHVGPAAPSAAEAWWQISAGNARALGLSNTGELRPGAAADLLVLNPTTPWPTSPDPLSTLLFGWDDRWLTRTVVGGTERYAGGQS